MLDASALLTSLARWQATMQEMDKQADALRKITGGVEGGIFWAIIDLQGRYTQEVCDRFGLNDGMWELLIDWGCSHNYGAKPMSVALDGVWRDLATVGDLVDFICGVGDD